LTRVRRIVMETAMETAKNKNKNKKVKVITSNTSRTTSRL